MEVNMVYLSWIIIGVLISAFCYLITEANFWLFVQVFGIIDRHLQDRHFRKLQQLQNKNGLWVKGE